MIRNLPWKFFVKFIVQSKPFKSGFNRFNLNQNCNIPTYSLLEKTSILYIWRIVLNYNLFGYNVNEFMKGKYGGKQTKISRRASNAIY